jgi:membrane associated rhomboid family serine protease
MRLSGRRPSSFTRPWTQRQRFVLLSLIGLNVVAFVAQLFLDAYDAGFTAAYLGLSENGIQNAYAWQFLTAPFMHYGAWHLLGNTAVLYLLGRDVECIVGSATSSFLPCRRDAWRTRPRLLDASSSVLFGASGGVAAVLMAYATILPELELTCRPLQRRLPIEGKASGIRRRLRWHCACVRRSKRRRHA